MRPQLRLYTGEDAGPALAEPQISVPFSEVLTALVHALRCNRKWPHDFEDDEVHVSSDLYEVISAYNHLRPSA